MQTVTVVDLNNFAYYPTQSVGYLTALLRKAGYPVDVISPLNSGIVSPKRERVEGPLHLMIDKFRHGESLLFRMAKKVVMSIPRLFNASLNKGKVFEVIKANLNLNTDLVLVSTYFENFYVCKELAAYLKANDIPVIFGGPGFNDKDTAREWLAIDGIDIIVGSEVDQFLTAMLKDFFAGEDITRYPGVYTTAKPDPEIDYVFRDLDSLPVADYSDFPWEKYPQRVIPYATSRGCSWGRCNFCTDVTYVNGRGFRRFSKEKIFSDLAELSQRHQTNIINFTDIKLNSSVKIWNALIDELPLHVKDPRWFCSVHVDNRKQNGLDRDSLFKARESGLLRISFGLESGSQRLLDHMQKGTTVERLEAFARNVYEAGISLRATMFIGYPYEDQEDLKATYEFLEGNGQVF